MDEPTQRLDDQSADPTDASERGTRQRLGGALAWKESPVLADGTYVDDEIELQHRGIQHEH